MFFAFLFIAAHFCFGYRLLKTFKLNRDVVIDRKFCYIHRVASMYYYLDIIEKKKKRQSKCAHSINCLYEPLN